MASITIPTDSPVTLNPGEEYTTTIKEKADYILTFTLDRGTGSVLVQNSSNLIQGTDVFNRPIRLALDPSADPNIMAKATLAGAVITLSAVKAPASTYGTAAVAPGVAHQVNFVPDSNKPETQSAVIYFGESVQASVQEVFVHDGDVVIPAHATAHVPVGHSITITPLVEQTKAVAQA